MKAVLALFGLILFGQSALANQSVFTYRPLLVEQSKPGNFCPQLSTAVAVNKRNSLRGQAVHLTDVRGESAVYTFQFPTRSCKSDIICETENHYASKSSAVEVVLKVNNDGAYPTTDLPGYSTLRLSWKGSDNIKRYCYYMLL